MSLALAHRAAFEQASNTPHRQPGHVSVVVSLKPIGGIPGDALGGPDGGQRRPRRPLLHAALARQGLATANINIVTDIIACPDMDYGALATARSIPITHNITERFGDRDVQHVIGLLHINTSGCINACGEEGLPANPRRKRHQRCRGRRADRPGLLRGCGSGRG